MRTHRVGEAVIADADAAEIAFLASFNDKILTVDMEAGGLGQACHERSAVSGQRTGGWWYAASPTAPTGTSPTPPAGRGLVRRPGLAPAPPAPRNER